MSWDEEPKGTPFFGTHFTEDGTTIYVQVTPGPLSTTISIMPDYGTEGYSARLSSDQARSLMKSIDDREQIAFGDYGLVVSHTNRGDPYQEGVQFSFEGSSAYLFVAYSEIEYLMAPIRNGIPKDESTYSA